MKYAVLGTGMVGRAIASRLVELGHETMMGSRSADGGAEWADAAGDLASAGTFAEAAGFGELVFNCTAGSGAVEAVTSAADALAGKVLIDVTNPIDASGDAPTLFTGIDDSLGERVQAAVPSARVVKALNTINADVMTHPGIVPGEHVCFVCGDDEDAKRTAVELLGEFGWPPERVIDCGDLTGARATEAYLLIWLKMWGAIGSARWNIAIERGTD